MKKIISKVLAFVLVLSLIAPCMMFKVDAATVSGSGTEADPYIIKNEADFKILDQKQKYISYKIFLWRRVKELYMGAVGVFLYGRGAVSRQ